MLPRKGNAKVADGCGIREHSVSLSSVFRQLNPQVRRRLSMKIVIYMDGGLVQQVALTNVPKELEKPISLAGFIAEVRNYDKDDVTGADAEDVKKDDAGNEFLGHVEEVAM
jgi:hypothetical protein